MLRPVHWYEVRGRALRAFVAGGFVVTGFVMTGGACATSGPADTDVPAADDSAMESAVPTSGTEEASAPPQSNPSPPPNDAGQTMADDADSTTPVDDATLDSSSPVGTDGAVDPTDASVPSDAGDACDTKNLKYAGEAAFASNPPPCTPGAGACAATQCCYQVLPLPGICLPL